MVFLFCAPWAELLIFVNTNSKNFNRFHFSFFDKAERIRSANIASCAKQLVWFSTTNNGTLDAGIRELIPDVAA